MQKKRYTNEDIIAQLQRCYEDNHNEISMNLYRKGKYKPSVDTIANRFGSWTHALQQAGIASPHNAQRDQTGRKGTPSTYTDDEIIASLRRCLEEQNAVSAKAYQKGGYKPGRTTIANHFGSWNNALIAAGIPPHDPNEKQFTDEDIFEQLRACYDENEQHLSMDKYIESKRIPTAHTIIKYFGSWNNAVEQAGITPNESHIKTFSKEDILRRLRELYIENNYYLSVLTYTQIKNANDAGIQVIKKQFKTWNNALIEAGLPINAHVDTRYTEQELLQALVDVYAQYGHITRELYLEKQHAPHLHTIIYYFGTWEDALRRADIHPERDRRQYTRDDMLQSIAACITEHQSTSITTYTDGGYVPTYSTIQREFGSWKEAVQETLRTMNRDDIQKTR